MIAVVDSVIVVVAIALLLFVAIALLLFDAIMLLQLYASSKHTLLFLSLAEKVLHSDPTSMTRSPTTRPHSLQIMSPAR